MGNLKFVNALVFVLFSKEISSFRCDRRPYGATSHASPSDGRFQLEVLEADNNAYIPNQVYTVRLSVTDDISRFTGFMISVDGDNKPDPRNPRRTVALYPGQIRPMNAFTARFSDRCLYSIEQASSSSKTSVEAYWEAPSSGNGCVTLRAMVIESDATWFEDGSPLTQKLCEDMRQPDDVAPQLNYDCQICDEAKYEVSFTGIWSRNTHPRLYPENDWVPRYSDLVGASHAPDLILWSPGTFASNGLKDLAEHANSSKFEAEIREKVGDGVRTMIMGKGHGYRKMGNPTYSFFRTDKTNHVFTVAVGLYPSPDWFLGVSRFELCQDNAWLTERELNLYPWDAGTDSGVQYESANIETFPQDSVTRVQMSSYDKNSPFYEMDMKNMHPFGKLHIQLIRTYHRDCEENTEEPTEEGGEEETNEEETKADRSKTPEPEEPSRYQNPEIDSGELGGETEDDHKPPPVVTTEAPAVPDPESAEECPLTPWSQWSACEGSCEDGKIAGYKWRERYHLVDGVAVEKYDPNARHSFKKHVSKYCKTHYADFERNECEDECPASESDEEPNVERRISDPVTPWFSWFTKKRDVLNSEKSP